MRASLLIFAAALALASPVAQAQTADPTADAVRTLLDSRDRTAGRPVVADDIAALRRSLADRDAQIAGLQAQIDRLSPPPEPDLSPAVSFGTVAVGPGQRVAQVPISLSAPTDHTVALRWMAQNGTGTFQGAHFPPSSGWVVFQPGEQTKAASVPLLRDLGAGQTIRIVLTSTPNNPPLKQTKFIGTITGGAPQPVAASVFDAVALPARPTGKALAWSRDFAAPSFCVTDTGKGANGAPCWQGRPTHGLTQDGNKELGLYASPDRFPAVTMTGLGSDGKRFIQLERHPEGFSEGGKPLVHAWDQKPYVYSSAMLQGSKLGAQIGVGSYVEARLKMDLVQGTWPAFWLLSANGSWPPEIDVFEGFWRKGYVAADVLTMSLHWVKAQGGNGTYGTDVPLALAVPGFDVRDWHVYGVSIEADWLTYYVDDVPVWRAPNASRRGTVWYPLFDVTTGGLVGEPPADAPLPAKMGLDWIRVWN